jgi:hypothetical protein
MASACVSGSTIGASHLLHIPIQAGTINGHPGLKHQKVNSAPAQASIESCCPWLERASDCQVVALGLLNCKTTFAQSMTWGEPAHGREKAFEEMGARAVPGTPHFSNRTSGPPGETPFPDNRTTRFREYRINRTSAPPSGPPARRAVPAGSRPAPPRSVTRLP